MLALDARLTLLVIVCGLSAQWLAPHAAVRAAVISRAAHRQTFRDLPPRDDSASAHSQRVLPWPAKARVGTTRFQKRDVFAALMSRANAHDYTRSKVRMNDFAPSNPLSKLADAMYSVIKHKGHHKRSHKSIIIPNDHGSAYVVSHARRAETPLWRVKGGSTTTPRPRKRDDSSSSSSPAQGVPGTVGIMSHVNNSTDGRLIASLYMTNMNGTYVLNASETNKTQMYLIPAAATTTSREPTASGASDTMSVNLAVPAFSNSEPYCATFDPNPDKPQPMTMEKCQNASDPAASPHSSQTFMYSKRTGSIRPMWFSGRDDGTSDNITAQAASSSDNNSTMSMSANGTWVSTSSALPSTSSSTTLSSRGDSSTPSRNTQNVTLVFIPAGKEAATAAATDANDSAVVSQNSTTSSSSVITTTTTRTVTVFATGSMSGSSVSGMATASAAASSQSAGGLDVELVGDGSLPTSSTPSPSGSASGSGSVMASSTIFAQEVQSSSVSAQPSSSTPASSSAAAATKSSINAAAIAASIAASASASSSSALAGSMASSSAASATAASDDAASTSPASASLSISLSGSGSATSQNPSSSTYVAAVIQRDAPAMTAVSTAPYQWKFKAESR